MRHINAAWLTAAAVLVATAGWTIADDKAETSAEKKAEEQNSAEEQKSSGDLFNRLDKNGDGTISADELPGGQSRFFERLVKSGDKNDDSKLTREEFQSAIQRDERPSGDAPQFGRLLGGGDGFDPKRVFERLDANKDGKLTKDELPEPLRDRLGRVFDRLGKEELTSEEFAQLGRGLREGGGGPEAGGLQVFQRMDKNGDGKLTLDELPEPARDIFEPLWQAAGKEADQGLSPEEFGRLLAERFGRGGRDGERGERPGDAGRARRPDGPPDRPVPPPADRNKVAKPAQTHTPDQWKEAFEQRKKLHGSGYAIIEEIEDPSKKTGIKAIGK